MMYKAWLCPLNVPTNDGRILAYGAIYWPHEIPILGRGELTSSIRAIVGDIQNMRQENGWIVGDATLDREPEHLGLGVELDDVEIDLGSDLATYIQGQLRTAVLTDKPAWPDARLEAIK